MERAVRAKTSLQAVEEAHQKLINDLRGKGDAVVIDIRDAPSSSVAATAVDSRSLASQLEETTAIGVGVVPSTAVVPSTIIRRRK